MTNDNNENKIDELLNNLTTCDAGVARKPDTQLVSFGPNAITQVFNSTMKTMVDADAIVNYLINYFKNPAVLSRLTTREKRDLLNDVATISMNNKTFTLHFVDTMNKNALLTKLVKDMQEETETVYTDDGYSVLSASQRQKRNQLRQLIRDELAERYRDQ